jgi:hypothetical protein
VAEGRRHTFEDSIRQNLLQLEREVDEKRQALGRLARDRSAYLERVSAGQLQALEDSTAHKTAEIRWVAAAHEESLDKVAAAGSAELEETAREQFAAFEDLATARTTELEDLYEQIHELVKVVTNAARELEAKAGKDVRHLADGALVSRDDVRQPAEETAVFEAFVGDRLVEFENALNARCEALHGALDEETRFLRDIIDEQIGQARSQMSSQGERLEHHAAVFDRFTAEHLANLERLKAQRSQLEDSAIERLRAFETHLARRQAEIETLGNDKVAALEGQMERLESAEHAIEDRIAQFDAHTANVSQMLERRAARVTQAAEEGAQGLEEAVARATSELDAAAAARTRDFEETAVATGAAVRDDLCQELARAQAQLVEAMDGRSSELEAMIVAARTSLEQVADNQVAELDRAGAALRGGIEQLRHDITAALEESADRQRAALDRAGALWLGRLEKAGRKTRRAGSWRRTTPPVAAVVFAIAAAIGGTMLLRDDGQERSRATPASEPEVSLALPAYSPIPKTTPSTSAAPPTDASADLVPIHWRADQKPSPPQPAGFSPPNAAASPASSPRPISAVPVAQHGQQPPSRTKAAGSRKPGPPTKGHAAQASSQ